MRRYNIPRHYGQKSFFLKKSVHSANKIEKTQFCLLKSFNYQNYQLLIRYFMFYNIEICMCIKSEICSGTLIDKTSKLYFN